MKQIQKRMLLQTIIGFLMGQVCIFGTNAVGLAYFAAGYTEGGSIIPVGIAVFLGMFSSMSPEMSLSGVAAMVCLVLAGDLLEKRKVRISRFQSGVITAVSSAALWSVELYTIPHNEYTVLYVILSAVLLIACTVILGDGVHYILYSGHESDEHGAERIMEERLKNVSDAFYSISRSMLRESVYAPKINNFEMRKLLSGVNADACYECVERRNLGYKNYLNQSRLAVAGQIYEVGDIVKGLAADIPKLKEFTDEVERNILNALRLKRVVVENVFAYERSDGHLEITIDARTGHGRLVTAQEVAKVISEKTGRTIRPADESRKVLVKETSKFIFVEDNPLCAVTGIARVAKDGEEVSGDSFSCTSLPNGEMLIALSDGMGSGVSALEESENVLDLLEQMVEAGFSHVSAIRLINSLYMSRGSDDRYATADIVVLNLFHGDCSFLKNGASATYIVRGQHKGNVEKIEGQTLPVGIVGEIDSYIGKVDISDGDYVIMMTDGVSDCFEDNEEGVMVCIKECKKVNPQQIADYIIDEAIKYGGSKVSDDMSVIVVGIWDKK